MASPQQLLAALESSFVPLEETEAFGKFLIYGASGTGKTVWAMKLAQEITPPGKDIIFIDAVEGWVSLINHPELKNRVRRTRYQGLSQIETLCQAIQAKAGSFANVGCIVCDEYSTMARNDVDVVVTARAAKETEKDPDVYTFTETGASTRPMDKGTPKLLKETEKDPDVATFTDTGASTRRMDRGTRKLLNVTADGVHLIIIAHERKDKDKSNIEVCAPSFMPAFNAIVKESMHVVGRMSANEGIDDKGNPVYRWSIQVHPTRQVVAKSRVGGLAVHNSPARFISVTKAWLEGTGTTEKLDRKPVNDIIEVESADDETFGGIMEN